MLKQLLRGAGHPPIEVELSRGPEESIPVEIHAWSVREGGRIAGVQGTYRDLRPRLGVHEESLGTTELYGRLFELTPEAIIITGASGKVVKTNRAAARMFGFETPEAMLGHKGVSLYADPSERETIIAQLREHGFAIQPDGRFRRKDGSHGHCCVRVQALYDQSGQVLGAVGFLTDVTAEREAGKALRESEHQFRTLAEASPNMIFMVADGKIVYANKAAEEALGPFSPSSPLRDIVAQEHWEGLRAYLEAAQRRNQRDRLECTLISPAGQHLDALVHLSPVEHKGGRAVLVVATDISGQKRTERILRDVEAKYRTLVEQSAFGVALLSLEPLQLLLANEALARILGCAREKLLGMRGQELLARVHPNDRARIQEFLGKAFAAELRRHSVVRVIDVDGGVHHIECEVRRVTIGGIPLLQFTAIDITERLRAETALRESQERYRAVVEDQTELICRRSADGTILFVNEAYCRYYGKQAAELVGTKFMPAMPDNQFREARDHFLALRPSRPTLTHEHIVLNAKGEQRWMQWTTRALFGRRGRLTGMQAVGRDVTEQKRAEQMAKERTEDLALVARMNGAIAAGAGIQRVLHICAQGLMRSFGCKMTTVLLRSEDGRFLLWDKRMLTRTQTRKIEEAIRRPLPSVRIDLECSPHLRAALLAEALELVADEEGADALLAEFARAVGVKRKRFPVLRQLLGMPPAINVPLLCGQEHVGLVSISRGAGFTETEVARLRNIAEALVLAVKHHNLEDSLRRNEERLRLMAANLNEGLAIIEDDKVVYANPRLLEIFACPAESLEPAMLLQCAAPEEQMRVCTIVEEAQRLGRREVELEYWIVLNGGSRRFVRSRYVRCMDRGKVRTYLIASDLTEHRLADVKRERLIGQLLQTLSEVKTLTGLLPICSSCKKIRDDKGYWHRVESYLSAHTSAQLSCALCPECARKTHGQSAQKKAAQTRGRGGRHTPPPTSAKQR
jgi:PAS domain S-box-containing protein